jgi:hypothetical protein
MEQAYNILEDVVRTRFLIAMIELLGRVIDSLGPGGFGHALTGGFCLMLVAMMGTHVHTDSAVVALMIGLTSFMFGFCLAVSVFVIMRSAGIFMRSLLRRDG